MPYEESNERKRSNSYFRISMDIGMGLFYTIIGGLIMYAKAFGTVQIPAVIAYIVGAMMVIGGLFRFYRGIKALLPQKKNNDSAAE
jgi:predicted phage tail protein